MLLNSAGLRMTTLLSFVDQDIEARFRQHQFSRLIQIYDLNVFCFFVVVYTACSFAIPRKHSTSIGWLLYGTVIALHAMALWLKETGRVTRTSAILCSRVLYQLASFPMLLKWNLPSKAFPAVIRGWILPTGVFAQLYYAFGMPLKFQEHIAVQTALGLANGLVLHDHSCSKLVAFDQGNETISNLCQWMNRITQVIFVEPIAFQRNSAVSRPNLCGMHTIACHLVVALVQFSVGVVLPSCVLYAAEYRLRKRFAAEHMCRSTSSATAATTSSSQDIRSGSGTAPQPADGDEPSWAAAISLVVVMILGWWQCSYLLMDLLY